MKLLRDQKWYVIGVNKKLHRKERVRDRHTYKQTERESDKEKQRGAHRQKERDIVRDKGTEIKTQTERNKEGQIEIFEKD